jgi:hypothetical protein
MLNRVLLLASFVALFGLSCGGDKFTEVGAECRGDSDCAADSFCLRGGDYPDGLCTVSCDHSGHCPSHTECIDREGGICMVTCSHNRDCPDRWKCDDKRRRGDPGEADVCVGD